MHTLHWAPPPPLGFPVHFRPETVILFEHQRIQRGKSPFWGSLGHCHGHSPLSLSLLLFDLLLQRGRSWFIKKRFESKSQLLLILNRFFHLFMNKNWLNKSWLWIMTGQTFWVGWLERARTNLISRIIKIKLLRLGRYFKRLLCWKWGVEILKMNLYCSDTISKRLRWAVLYDNMNFFLTFVFGFHS